MPGMPASLTTATRSPRASRSSTSATAPSSVWSLTTISGRRGTPACCSRRPVRRVSSQQIASAAASASTARGDRSPRLPIGVPTSTRRHGRSARSSSWSPTCEAPPGEATRPRPRSRRGPAGRVGSGGGGAVGRRAARTRSVSQKATSIGNRMPSVWTARAGRRSSAPSMPSRPSRPRRRALRGRGDLEAGQHLPVPAAARPWSDRSPRTPPQTLKRISRTSPSATS